MKKTPIRIASMLTPIAFATLLALGACGGGSSSNSSNTGTQTDATTAALQSKVKNIVVIYAENRSFDNLYGNFPGANGLGAVLNADGTPTAAYVPQKDRDGATVLSSLPPVWGGVTMGGSIVTVTQQQSAGLPNAPFDIGTAFKASANATIDGSVVTRDL